MHLDQRQAFAVTDPHAFTEQPAPTAWWRWPSLACTTMALPGKILSTPSSGLSVDFQ
jgi:hypothetical protein